MGAFIRLKSLLPLLSVAMLHTSLFSSGQLFIGQGPTCLVSYSLECQYVVHPTCKHKMVSVDICYWCVSKFGLLSI